MEQPWRVAAAVGVIGALIGGIAWFGLRHEEDPSPAASTSLAAAVPASVVSTTVVASTTAGATKSPPQTTADPNSAGATDQAVLDATAGALAAWGEFAVTGDLAIVSGWFVAHGPQLVQLRAEAAELLATPLGSPAYRFELFDPTVVTSAGGVAVVSALVTMTRPGEPDQELDWRIHLHRIDGVWQLWTVETVE